ncbi:DUF5753 domain-containing protein [Streptomyces sp. NPDC001848]|uniref:DUF5753 domain-containing protein n=1 Tax=Streptomyces sp. NPDC001848 TaxID=3364618 RepID=UPI00369FAFB3
MLRHPGRVSSPSAERATGARRVPRDPPRRDPSCGAVTGQVVDPRRCDTFPGCVAVRPVDRRRVRATRITGVRVNLLPRLPTTGRQRVVPSARSLQDHATGLQTADYARAVFSYRVPEPSEDEVELRVDHRMQRKVTIQGPNPIPYRAVSHEAALRIRASDSAASQAQLTQILELSEAEHITVRVIPFDLEGFAGALSGMAYAGATVPKLDTIVCDSPIGAEYIHSEAELEGFRTLFQWLESASLDTGKSRDLIRRLAREM